MTGKRHALANEAAGGVVPLTARRAANVAEEGNPDGVPAWEALVLEGDVEFAIATGDTAGEAEARAARIVASGNRGEARLAALRAASACLAATASAAAQAACRLCDAEIEAGAPAPESEPVPFASVTVAAAVPITRAALAAIGRSLLSIRLGLLPALPEREATAEDSGTFASVRYMIRQVSDTIDCVEACLQAEIDGNAGLRGPFASLGLEHYETLQAAAQSEIALLDRRIARGETDELVAELGKDPGRPAALMRDLKAAEAIFARIVARKAFN